MNTQFPSALQFLLEPKRYKIVYGGRGGAKSENFSQALILLGAQCPLRVLCTRETQRSIQSSVHAMLAAWIEKLGLGSVYDVQNAKIVSRLGGEFLFSGMQDMNAIKSIHSIDITWVEEAQTVPKASWEKLIPTVLRKPGSELWVSFNPELDTDDTYQRFVLDPPADATVIKTTYRDNPFLTDELRTQMLELREKDYQAYLHVWEGETKSAVSGAVYGDEMAQAESEGRIKHVPYDRTRPVYTFWDLGFGDETAIWFVQLNSPEYRLIDYIAAHGKTIEWYMVQLQQRGYVYKTHWLPHDGVDTVQLHRLSGNRSRSVEQMMRDAGLNVRIAPKMLVATGINAARTVFPMCSFDRDNCNEGLRALKSYQWGPASKNGVAKREPLHDWASHGSDAFRTMAIAQPLEPPKPKPEKPTSWDKNPDSGYSFMR